MQLKGTIYKAGKSSLHGETRIVSILTKVGYHLMRGIGAGLIGFFVIAFLFYFGPLIKEEVNYQLQSRRLKSESLIYSAEASSVIEVQKEASNWSVNTYFSVVIPKIEAASNIVANVDTNDKEEYFEALTRGVAHAKGTHFPGQGKNIFLFAHSTDLQINIARLNAEFFLLRKLEAGDKIIIYFADQKYVYEVEEKVIVDANDISWLLQGDSEKLVLLTCDPPGTTWRRLIIMARPA